MIVACRDQVNDFDRKAGALADEKRPPSATGIRGRLPPPARDQWPILARDLKVPIYPGTPEEKLPIDLARSAKREAVNTNRDVLLVDTAGRLHIDDQLMTELQQLKELLNPVEILLVADAMTGQTPVKSAGEFHQKLGITGVILTKMDGDARGAPRSPSATSLGQPLKFVGLGEKPDAFEPFYPDRAPLVSRHGRHCELRGKGAGSLRHEVAGSMQRKMMDNEFSLEDSATS